MHWVEQLPSQKVHSQLMADGTLTRLHAASRHKTLHTVGMVRTGGRAEALSAALAGAGFNVALRGPPAPRLDVLPADLRAAVVALYRELGG